MFRHVLAVSMILAASAGSGPGLASTGDWTVRRQPTETRYRLQQGDSSFTVICTSPKFGGGATFDVVLKGVDAAPQTRTQVFVEDREFDLRHGMLGVGLTDCKACSEAFASLWTALRRPGVTQIELKRGQTSVTLPAAGGDQALGDCPTDFQR